jgi:hypothetical protein
MFLMSRGIMLNWGVRGAGIISDLGGVLSFYREAEYIAGV